MRFNGKDFAEFGVFVDESKAFGSPEKDYELVEILGRNGNLSIYNDRFKDITLPFPCFIRTGFIAKYRSLLAYLNSQTGYQRLETDKEPNHFRKALFQGIVDPQTTAFNHGGFFTVNLLAHPQRFLKSGEIPVSATELWNPTYFDSHPLIRCYGNGSLMINSQTITVASNPYDYVDIDCDIMDAFYGANNANSYVSFDTDSVVLKSGVNSITHNMTKVEITPRWYEI